MSAAEQKSDTLCWYTSVHTGIRWYDTVQAVSLTMHSIYLTSCMLSYRVLLEIDNHAAGMIACFYSTSDLVRNGEGAVIVPASAFFVQQLLVVQGHNQPGMPC